MDIGSILQNLSEDDMAKLKETASRFFGANEVSGVKNGTERGEDNRLDFSSVDPEMLKNVARISSLMNRSDARSDFLMSLKPLLSDGRQKKADEAATMLRLLSVLNTMRGNGA